MFPNLSGQYQANHDDPWSYNWIGFHGNLADHLLLGEPLVAALDDSIKVVAILEAVAQSGAKNGTVEELNG